MRISRGLRRWLIVIGVVLLLSAVVGVFVARNDGGLPGDVVTRPPASWFEDSGTDRQLQEDDPGWDCRTMGNRVCGEDVRV